MAKLLSELYVYHTCSNIDLNLTNAKNDNLKAEALRK